VCDGVWGALAAVNRQGEEFGSPDAKLVRSTSSACAIFIENRRLYRELQEMMLDLMRALVSSIDAKDPYTCGHSERVAMTCRKIAVRLGLRDEEVEHVYLAGLLHDIGKIGTPEAILRKEGRLEPEERLIMIQHPSVGSHILAGIRKLEVIREAVLSHHERIDGKGYPAGLAGDRIPMLARIVGMADAFDAMTSNRPYRPVMPLAQVKREIERNTGTQFDARVAEALLSLDLERLMEELAARVSHAAAR
jgi:putative nucleotidyltransferase with HDIG domain